MRGWRPAAFFGGRPLRLGAGGEAAAVAAVGSVAWGRPCRSVEEVRGKGFLRGLARGAVLPTGWLRAAAAAAAPRASLDLCMTPKPVT